MKITLTETARVELDRLLQESPYVRPGVRIRVTGMG